MHSGLNNTETASPPWRRWQIVGLLMALCFISHLNRISMSVAGDERIMKQYSITPTEMGTVYSAFLLVYAIYMILGGFFIDLFGTRVALMVVGFGSAFFGACTGLLGLGLAAADQMWISLIFVRGLMGLFTTPLHPGCARAVSEWTPLPQRSLTNGLVNGAALLGIACTYKIVGLLIDWFDWPTSFIITGSFTALLTVLWTLCSARRPTERTAPSSLAPIAPGERGSSGGTSINLMNLLKNRSLLLLTVSYGAVGYFQYLFFYWMHYYFDTVLNLGKSESRFYAGIPPLAMAVGMPLGGWLSDRLQRRLGFRWGRAIVPLAGMIIGAVLLGLGVVVKDPIWIVAWFSLALGVVGACEGSFWSTAVELGGLQGGTAAAIVNTGGNGGGLLAPIVTPFVSKYFHWQLGISLGGIVCFLGALCWLWIDPQENLKSGESNK